MSKPPARKSAIPRKSSGTTSKSPKSASRLNVEPPSKADEPVETSKAPRPSKNILSAGIKALANAHGEAVARQSRVFESLLGLTQHGDARRDANLASGEKSSAQTSSLDPFGFKKFEDVFDQRVARTLQRLGVPSAQVFADLTTEVERLREELARIKSAGKKR